MKISSSKGETEISCFFEDSLTAMLSLGFQTTIIIVGQRFPANPGGKPNRWARSRTDCKYAEESHGYINLASKDTKCWSSEFSGIQTHDLCLVSDAPILPKNAESKQWNVE